MSNLWRQNKDIILFLIALVFAILSWLTGSYESFKVNFPGVHAALPYIPYVLLSLVVVYLLLANRKLRKTILQEEELRLKTDKWRDIEKITGLVKYAQTLERSDYHPRGLREAVKTSLDFMGNGASKWTADAGELEKMIKEIQYRKGKARFLITNPLSDVHDTGDAENLKVYKKKVATSIRTFLELEAKYADTLEVKVYDHIPQFRLTFWKDSVAVGHYRGQEKVDSEGTPLLVFKMECDWSFYKALEFHFDVEWDRSTDIRELDRTKIQELIAS